MLTNLTASRADQDFDEDDAISLDELEAEEEAGESGVTFEEEEEFEDEEDEDVENEDVDVEDEGYDDEDEEDWDDDDEGFGDLYGDE